MDVSTSELKAIDARNRTIYLNHAEKMDNVKWNDEYIQENLILGNNEKDEIMNRFIPKLRKKMGFTENQDP
jgi:hypothetical protein